MILAETTLDFTRCPASIWLRYYHPQGGWVYLLCASRISEGLEYSNKEVKVDELFSRRSRTSRVVNRDLKATVQAYFTGISGSQRDAVVGILDAEKVERLNGLLWEQVKLDRQVYPIKEARANTYSLTINFETKSYV